MVTRVDLYQDGEGQFHYRVYEPKVKDGRKGPTICGLESSELRTAAWYQLDDPRGLLVYTRVCDVCQEGLEF